MHLNDMDDPFRILPLQKLASKLPNLESRFNYLRQLVSRLKTKHGLTPVFGGELEFYLLDSKMSNDLTKISNNATTIVDPASCQKDSDREKLNSKILQTEALRTEILKTEVLKTNKLSSIENWTKEELEKYLHIPIKHERGKQQYEIDLPVTESLDSFIGATNDYRNKIDLYARSNDKEAIFSPKPFKDDYGSSLHIHLNFLPNKSNVPLIESDAFNIEFYANLLCNYMNITRDYFLPTSECKSRLNHLYMSPTHISWGGNNRSCMIRIPDIMPKRIEHRLCGANIDLTLPIYAILSTIIYGIENPNSVKEFPRIYGNAFDSQYSLEEISNQMG